MLNLTPLLLLAAGQLTTQPIDGLNPTIPNGSLADIQSYIASLKPIAGNRGPFKLLRMLTPSVWLFRDLMASTNVGVIYECQFGQAYSDVIAGAKSYGGNLFAVEAPNEFLTQYAVDSNRPLYYAKAKMYMIWWNGLADACAAAGIKTIAPMVTPIYPVTDKPITGFKGDYGSAHIYADFDNPNDPKQAWAIPAARWELACYPGRQVVVTENGSSTFGSTQLEQRRIILSQWRWFATQPQIVARCVYQHKNQPGVAGREGFFGIDGNLALWALRR